MQQKILLIAGSGKFPFLFAQAAKEKGFYVSSVAIKNNTDWRLKRYVDAIRWFKISEFRKIIEFLRDEPISNVAMAGQIRPQILFDKKVFQDEELRKLMIDLKDRRADSIFGAIAQKLEANGLKVLDSTLFLEKHLPQKGILTKEEPNEEVWGDINFGFQIAKEIARLDIGQTVVVKNKTVVAVEAFEGTDRTIRRAGYLVPQGCVVVKVSKPKQDKRFDIPVLGLATIRNLAKIKAQCLAFEANRTLLIDRDKCIELASRHNIIIAAV